MREWLQISVDSSDQACDSVSEVLTGLGAVSVTFMDAADQPLYEPPPEAHPLWKQTRIVALFEQPVNPETVRDTLFRTLPIIPLRNWQAEVLLDRAWEREWMDHFTAMKFGKRLWVCPSHQTPPEPEAVNLMLDPGLAFGTGTHPTTALCLEWLAQNDLRNLKIIDYGCGSGILAIAAVLLGADRAVAVDIDPQALSATADNARNNGVGNRIHCGFPEQLAPETADIVIANILAKPLEDLAAVLTGLLNPGGKLVLSGFLQDQIDAVQKAYRRNFAFDAPVQRENWVRLDGIRVS